MRNIEIIVGIFIIAGFLAFLMLAYEVSGYSDYTGKHTYTVFADFDNVGDLKARAPVTIAGVRVGEVSNIKLDRITFKAKVQIKINATQAKIPDDSSAQILTEGLLGSNYIGLTPGFSEDSFLKEGSHIEETHPALILEDLIGQLVFQLDNKDEDKKGN